MAGFSRRSQEDIDRKVAQRENQSSNVGYFNENAPPIFNPTVGENAIRILPFDPADKMLCGFLGLEAWHYYLKGSYWLSPKTMKAHNFDPLHEQYLALKNTGDMEAARKFQGSKRCVVFLLDLSKDANSKEVMIWAAPDNFISSIITLSRPRAGRGQLVDVSDPDDGRVITFNRTGAGIQTRYEAIVVEPESSPVDDALASQIMRYGEFVYVPSPEEITAALAVADVGGGTDMQPSSLRGRPQVSPVAEGPDAGADDDEIPFGTGFKRRKLEGEEDGVSESDPRVAADGIRKRREERAGE